MMPALKAREALSAADVVAYGTGHLKKSDASNYRRRLMREAGLSSPRRLQPARSTAIADLPADEARARLAALGIGFNEVAS